jgi:hypothetical protein
MGICVSYCICELSKERDLYVCSFVHELLIYCSGGKTIMINKKGGEKENRK